MYIYIIIGTLYCETNNISRPSPPPLPYHCLKIYTSSKGRNSLICLIR